MTTQILPQVLVYQEAALVAAAITSTLKALVLGPDYAVQKYTTANKANVDAGAYAAVDVTFGYPQRAAGDLVDQTFTKVFLENALAQYFTDAVGSGDTFSGTATSITGAATVFQTANGVTRSVSVPVDVAVGDKVRLTKTSQADFNTSVLGFVAATVVTAPGTATADGANVGSAVATSSGTYTGSRDTVYKLTATSTGTIGTDIVTFAVTTNNGVDVGSISLAATYTGGTAVAVGSLGVLVAFTEAAVTTGDRYTIAATANTLGAVKTLVVADQLPTTYQSGDFAVSLYKSVSAEVNADRSIGVKNWTADATTVTLKSGITVDLCYGALPVVEADAYVEWRGISTRNANLQTVSNVSELATYFPGYVGPESGLAYGLSKALANSNGAPVDFLSVATDDVAGWTAALDVIKDKSVYGIAALTKSRAVKDLVAAHVADASSPEQGRWRVAWFGSEEVDTAIVVGGEAEILATIADNPAAAGTQYTLVVAANGNFITNGVRSGDKLRVNYSLDALGAETYEEYTVDTVQNNQRLVLLTGPSAAVSTAGKIQVWRTLTSADKTSMFIDANSFATKRVRHIFPATVEAADGVVDSMFVGAALAGLRSGVAPHQGLTNVAIAGFTGVSKTRNEFTRSQQDALATAGFWIVTQDPATGAVYTRKQLTTDTSTVATAEDSVVSGDDAIAFAYANVLSKYVGRTNITDSNMALIRSDLDAVTVYLKAEGFTPNLGGLVVAATVVSLRRHAIYADRLVAVINVTRPAPLNNLELHLVYGF
jgi:hypothetical protein